MGSVTVDEAWAVLGLDAATSDATAVRRAYLAAVRAAHPDRNDRSDATERTARLTVAYRVIVDALEAPTEARPAAPGPTPTPAPRPEPVVVEIDLRCIADDTIEVDAPLDLTFSWLMHAAHEIGDVTFLDRSAAMLQILVAFVDEPVCQMIFDLQGRAAHGTTEIFCTIDSIEDRDPPPIDAVTRFVAEHLAATSLGG